MENTKLELKGALVRYIAYVTVCLMLMITGSIYSDGSFSAAFWLTDLILLVLSYHLFIVVYAKFRQFKGS